mmetsp:Transcript_25233/g.58672  ORF Transcript_25233/g.58672 Transcript_25233/m.58672 type:complete len:328 (+) Transcript_25233:187-1170(+)
MFFGPPRGGPGLVGALVTGAVVGGAIAATRPPPPRYGYGPPRRRYHRQIVVVREQPAGMAPLGPNERLILITCPEGVSAGGTLEIEVEGQNFQVTVPQGIWAGKKFYARVQLVVQQPQATATATAAPVQQYQQPQQQQQQQQFTATAAPVPAAPGNFTVTATEVPPPAPGGQTAYAAPTAQQVNASTAQMASAVVMDDKVQGAAAAESNPFLDNDSTAAAAPADASGWSVTPYKDEFETFFWNQGPERGKLSPAKVKDALMTTGLPKEVLRSVWELSDLDKDGMLDMDEFSVAVYLCRQSQSGFPIPAALPADVVPPSKRYLASNPF